MVGRAVLKMRQLARTEVHAVVTFLVLFVFGCVLHHAFIFSGEGIHEALTTSFVTNYYERGFLHLILASDAAYFQVFSQLTFYILVRVFGLVGNVFVASGLVVLIVLCALCASFALTKLRSVIRSDSFRAGVAVSIGFFHILNSFEYLRIADASYAAALLAICLPFLGNQLRSNWSVGFLCLACLALFTSKPYFIAFTAVYLAWAIIAAWGRDFRALVVAVTAMAASAFNAWPYLGLPPAPTLSLTTRLYTTVINAVSQTAFFVPYLTWISRTLAPHSVTVLLFVLLFAIILVLPVALWRTDRLLSLFCLVCVYALFATNYLTVISPNMDGYTLYSIEKPLQLAFIPHIRHFVFGLVAVLLMLWVVVSRMPFIVRASRVAPRIVLGAVLVTSAAQIIASGINGSVQLSAENFLGHFATLSPPEEYKRKSHWRYMSRFLDQPDHLILGEQYNYMFGTGRKPEANERHWINGKVQPLNYLQLINIEAPRLMPQIVSRLELPATSFAETEVNGLHVFRNEFRGYGTSPDNALDLPSVARLDQEFQPLNNGLTGLWFSLQSSNLLASADVRMELVDVKTGTMLAVGKERVATASLRGLDGFRVGDDFVHFGFPPIKDSRQKSLRLVVHVKRKWYGMAPAAGIRTPAPDETRLLINGVQANAVLFSIHEYGAATAVVFDAEGAVLARARQLTPSSWWSKYFKFDKSITGAASIAFVDDAGEEMRWEARQNPGIIIFGRGHGSYRPALARAELH